METDRRPRLIAREGRKRGEGGDRSQLRGQRLQNRSGRYPAFIACPSAVLAGVQGALREKRGFRLLRCAAFAFLRNRRAAL